MKTPHLDNLINDLKAYDRNDMLSDSGRSQLNEYEAIKRALSLGAVVWQSGQLPNRCSVCGRTDEEITAMTSMCGVSACPY